MAKINYRCPTHGKVQPDNPGAAVPKCPTPVRRKIEGKMIVEPCGLPLTAYLA
jgi:hypothetical protein